MPVAFDANFLSVLLHPNSSVPVDLATKKPLDRCQDRIQELLEKLSRSKTKVVLPWPAIAEFMIFAFPSHQQYVEVTVQPSSADFLSKGTRQKPKHLSQ